MPRLAAAVEAAASRARVLCRKGGTRDLSSLLKEMGLVDTFSASLEQVAPVEGENCSSCATSCVLVCFPGCARGCSPGGK